jgi:hypothetical protein
MTAVSLFEPESPRWLITGFNGVVENAFALERFIQVEMDVRAARWLEPVTSSVDLALSIWRRLRTIDWCRECATRVLTDSSIAAVDWNLIDKHSAIRRKEPVG